MPDNKENISQQLKESILRYQNNFKNAPLAMCIFRGENFIVEAANDKILTIWNKNLIDVIDKPIFESLPEFKDEGLEEILKSVYTTGEKIEASEHEFILSKNGILEPTYIDFVYEALSHSDGTITGVVVAATDVTNQVNARRKLEESEKQIRSIIENAPFAIAVYVGEEMRIELANDTIIKIWGKGNDVFGKTFTEVLPELAEQDVFEQIKNVYKTGIPFYTENTPLDLVIDGVVNSYYFNYNFMPLYDLAGNIYAVMNTGIDLTDLNVAKKKIEISDARFRNSVRQAQVAIAIFRGSDYVTEMANDAYLELVGRNREDLMNVPLFQSIPEIEDTIKPLLDNVRITGIPFKGIEIEVPLLRNDKLSNCFFDVTYHPLKEEEQECSSILITAIEVTEKVEARKITEQNEERLKIVLEASELGTWELNLKTKKTVYSSRFLEIIGGYKNQTELTHEQLLQHLHPDDIYIRNIAFKEALISGNLNYEVRVIWKDNSIHWMEGKGKVFYDKNKKPIKIIGTIRDLTNERKDRQLLIDSEKKFRLLSDSMPQHIWTSDPAGNLNYFNKSVVEYSGLSIQEIIEKGWLEIVHPDDRAENTKQWIESIQTGKDFLLEHRFKRFDGEYRWQLSRAIPQRDENGAIQMWVGSSTDIQEQKMFAQELEKQVIERTKELKQTNETLQQSEERYHLMVGEVQDYAILYINTDGVVENWNKGAERIKGYTAEEIIGQNFSVFYTEFDRLNNLPQHLLSEAKRLGRYNQQGWRVRKNGTNFWANVVITAVHNSEKKLIGFSKVTHDLTSKKAADDKILKNAKQLEKKNIELENMNKELESFAYISSHDLQEPLRKIQTFSNQIIERESGNLTENGKDKFLRMQKAAKRMQTLINDLLAYSRTNTLDRKFIKSDLNSILAEVKEDLKEELQQKNGVLNIKDIKCDVEVIPFQIHQLMYNLISNSLKFSREDVAPIISVTCEIKVGKDLKINGLDKSSEYCHIILKDNGIGFDQQYSDKIFEVFQRLHGRDTYQGTGIGLAIVKKIIDNHNGIISATGEINNGAEFSVYIPVKAKKM